jgi:hypothetical protein
LHLYEALARHMNMKDLAMCKPYLWWEEKNKHSSK